MTEPQRIESRCASARKPLATIYDVAEATGVSPSTVSRALNKPGRLSEATERRVRDAAEELGYRANPMARALLTGKTGILALLVSDLTNPVYFDLVRGAEGVAAEMGLALVLAESQESAIQERAIAERLQVLVDGVVLVASRMDDEQIIEIASMKPLVIANRRVPGVPSVVPDVCPGIASALEDIYAHGHRRIAYLSGPDASWMNGLRWQTLFDSAVARDISIVEIKSAAPTREGGAEALPRVMAAGVTAVLAYNDVLALGLLRACRDRAIDIPGRLSLVGFDDIFVADVPSPSLSTIKSPLRELGGETIRRLRQEIEGEGECDAPILSTSYVSRESLARPQQ